MGKYRHIDNRIRFEDIPQSCDGLIALVRFRKNDSFFIKKREQLFPPWKMFKKSSTKSI